MIAWNPNAASPYNICSQFLGITMWASLGAIILPTTDTYILFILHRKKICLRNKRHPQCKTPIISIKKYSVAWFIKNIQPLNFNYFWWFCLCLYWIVNAIIINDGHLFLLIFNYSCLWSLCILFLWNFFFCWSELLWETRGLLWPSYTMVYSLSFMCLIGHQSFRGQGSILIFMLLIFLYSNPIL